MPLDLATLKARLGIPPEDTTKDAAIEATAEQAQALAEGYCDRKFDRLADVETLDPAASLLLRRWPLALDPAVIITDDAGRVVPAQNYRVDAERGMIRGRAVSWAPGWFLGWSPLTVTYTGGFDPWPSSLTWAVTNAFDVLWSETPGGGIEPGAPSTGGAVKRYGVVGAFYVDNEAGGVGEIGANEGAGYGALTGPICRALDEWRRESRLGAG